MTDPSAGSIAARDVAAPAKRLRLWHLALAGLLVLLLAPFVILRAMRTINAGAWVRTPVVLEAAGIPCGPPSWAVTLPPVDEATQRELWELMRAAPGILLVPATFDRWASGERPDPGDEARALLADHRASIDRLLALLRRPGVRADRGGWAAADVRDGWTASERQRVLDVAERCAHDAVAWLRLCALIERSPERLADLDLVVNAFGAGAAFNPFDALADRRVRDRTRLDALRLGVPVDEPTQRWLDEPTDARATLREACRLEAVDLRAGLADLFDRPIDAGSDHAAWDPRCWWEWATFPGEAAELMATLARLQTADGRALPDLPRTVRWRPSTWAEFRQSRLDRLAGEVSADACSGRAYRVAARLLLRSRREGRLARDAREAAAWAGAGGLDADDETCALVYASSARGDAFALVLDISRPARVVTALPFGIGDAIGVDQVLPAPPDGR